MGKIQVILGLEALNPTGRFGGTGKERGEAREEKYGLDIICTYINKDMVGISYQYYMVYDYDDSIKINLYIIYISFVESLFQRYQ